MYVGTHKAKLLFCIVENPVFHFKKAGCVIFWLKKFCDRESDYFGVEITYAIQNNKMNDAFVKRVLGLHNQTYTLRRSAEKLNTT